MHNKGSRFHSIIVSIGLLRINWYGNYFYKWSISKNWIFKCKISIVFAGTVINLNILLYRWPWKKSKWISIVQNLIAQDFFILCYLPNWKHHTIRRNTSRMKNSQFQTCGHMQSLDFMAHKVFSANLSDEPKHEILACRNVPTMYSFPYFIISIILFDSL